MYGVIPFLFPPPPPPPPPQMCKQFKTVLQSPYCYCPLTVSSYEKCYLLKHKQGNNRPNLKPKQVYQLIMACQLLHILFLGRSVDQLASASGWPSGRSQSLLLSRRLVLRRHLWRERSFTSVPILPVAESETCLSSTKSEDCLSS